MKVCFLTPVLDAFKGGNHLPLLAALGDIEFTILTNRMKPNNLQLPSNVRCETIGARIGPHYYGCADYFYAREVLRRYPPKHAFWKQFDVIHINQAMGLAFLDLCKTEVPTCVFIHHPVSADREIVLQESSGFARLQWRMKYALLVRWQWRLCNALPHLATVSHTAARRIVDDYGCDVSKIHIVFNGVDTDLFTPGDLAHSDFDAVAVGSFVHPRKGFRYLTDVYRKLSDKGLRIADVGGRSAEQQAELRTIKNVRSFGAVAFPELLNIMQKSSVLLSTSLYEGFGLSLIEALACGRPAFAFDAGAVREVLDPIDPDLVLPLRDTQGLADRVTRFLHLPVGERVRKGEHYRTEVAKRYPMKKAAEGLRAVYQEMAGRSRM